MNNLRLYTYRWNQDKSRFEYWYGLENMWVCSYAKSREEINEAEVKINWLSYQNTWCEPFEGMEINEDV